MTKQTLVVHALLILAVLGTPVTAATLHVPDQYDSVPEAVDAASTGDTVLVAAGHYVLADVLIDFNGKDVVVYAPAGPENTILDWGETEGGFFLRNGETADAVVDGFTIMNSDNPYLGGAFHIRGSAPTVKNCVMIGNNAAGFIMFGKGGAMYIADGASPTVIGCTISGNYAYGDACFYCGGGVYIANASATFIRSIIWNNCDEDIGSDSANSSVVLDCCAVDPASVVNVGEVEFIGDTILDPIYCAENPCGEEPPVLPNDYRLHGDSPCLPANNSCGVLIGALGVGCPTSAVPEPAHLISNVRVVPTPCYGSCRIFWSPSLGTPIEARILDAGGRVVRRLTDGLDRWDGTREPALIWDGRDDGGHRAPSGMFHTRIYSRKGLSAGRVILIR